MDNRFLVEVFVPAAEEKFDVFIPADGRFADVIQLIIGTVNELCKEKYIANDNTMLINRETGEIYRENMKINELNIENGSKLMLI